MDPTPEKPKDGHEDGSQAVPTDTAREAPDDSSPEMPATDAGHAAGVAGTAGKSEDGGPAGGPDPSTAEASAGTPPAGGQSPTERVIAAFGGIRPMAGKLKIPVTTVQGWKKRDHIPDTRHDDIVAAADVHKIDLDRADLAAAHQASSPEERAVDAVGGQSLTADEPVDAASDTASRAVGDEAAVTTGEPTTPVTRAADAVETAPEIERAETPQSVGRAVPLPPPQATPQARGGAGLMTSAVIAVLIAVVAAATAPWWGRVILPSLWEGDEAASVTGQIGALTERLEALEEGIAEAATAAAASDALDDRLAVLEQSDIPDRVAALEGVGPGSAALDRLAARLGDVEDAMAVLEGGSNDPTLAALTDRVTALEAGIPQEGGGLAPLLERLRALEQSAGAPSEAVDDLARRVAALEQAASELGLSSLDERLMVVEAALPQSVAAAERLAADLGQAVSALESRVDGIAGTVEDLSAATAGRLSSVEQATSAATAGLADTTSVVASLGPRLADLEAASDALDGVPERLAGLSVQVDALASDMAATRAHLDALTDGSDSIVDRTGEALAIAIGQLAESVAAGEPYARSLAAIRALAGDDPAVDGALSMLEGHAESGLPSRGTLASTFPAVAEQARAEDVSDVPGDWTDQVLAELDALVTIRPVPSTQVEGDDTSAVLARAQGYLDLNDLAETAVQLTALEGAAASAVAGWLSDTEARLAAEAAIRTLSQISVDRLAPLRPADVAGPEASSADTAGEASPP